MTTKQALRKMLRQRQPAGSAAEAFCVISRLSRNSHVVQAHTILLYSALPDEVPTQPLLDRLLQEGKTILLPRVTGETTMELRQYTGSDDLQAGAFGILEPTGEVFTAYDRIDTALIPGMAFDRNGHRLGRGKGYYDRFLPLLPRAYKIGVCYPSRILEQVPADSHDVVMDEVVTADESVTT